MKEKTIWGIARAAAEQAVLGSLWAQLSGFCVTSRIDFQDLCKKLAEYDKAFTDELEKYPTIQAKA